MSRVLLADDSPHAQRMGERILRDEGYEVVSVTDGETALLRLRDVDPDVVVVDAFLPRRSGFDIARHIKGTPALQHVSVVLTAGLLEAFNEDEARQAGSDAVLKKPFEATAMLEALRPLAETSKAIRARQGTPQTPAPVAPTAPEPVQPQVARPAAPLAPFSERRSAPAAAATSPAPVAPGPSIEPERVRAAVVLALDAAMPALIDELTQRVLAALKP